jgi:hypothetical protein
MPQIPAPSVLLSFIALSFAGCQDNPATVPKGAGGASGAAGSGAAGMGAAAAQTPAASAPESAPQAGFPANLPPHAPDVLTPQPMAAFRWVPGYYKLLPGSGPADARGQDIYFWLPGHWELPPPGCTVFVPPHFETRPSVPGEPDSPPVSVLVEGFWK